MIVMHNHMQLIWQTGSPMHRLLTLSHSLSCSVVDTKRETT